MAGLVSVSIIHSKQNREAATPAETVTCHLLGFNFSIFAGGSNLPGAIMKDF